MYCNINQAGKAIHRRPIRLTDSDHNFILDKIKRRYTIESNRKKSLDDM